MIRETEEINIIPKLYWHLRLKCLCISFSMTQRMMSYGSEWNAWRSGNIEHISGMPKEIVNVYELMSTYGFESPEEEAKTFGNLIKLYENTEEDNRDIAIQMFDGAAIAYVNENKEAFRCSIEKLIETLK